jgi:hypothetical protein
MSASKIAKAMTEKYDYTFTRNSIIGACHKYDINFTASRRKKKPKEKARSKPILIKYEIPEDQGFLDAFQEYHGEEIDLLALRNDTCRFPLERGDSHVFCGYMVVSGSYCKRHYDKCHIKEGNYILDTH